MKDKKIQIDKSMFIDMYKLIARLEGIELDNDTIELCKSLEKSIEEKISAMERHDTYTLSKTADTTSVREEARQKYLNLACIPKDFRYSNNSSR